MILFVYQRLVPQLGDKGTEEDAAASEVLKVCCVPKVKDRWRKIGCVGRGVAHGDFAEMDRGLYSIARALIRRILVENVTSQMIQRRVPGTLVELETVQW